MILKKKSNLYSDSYYSQNLLKWSAWSLICRISNTRTCKDCEPYVSIKHIQTFRSEFQIHACFQVFRILSGHFVSAAVNYSSQFLVLFEYRHLVRIQRLRSSASRISSLRATLPVAPWGYRMWHPNSMATQGASVLTKVIVMVIAHLLCLFLMCNTFFVTFSHPFFLRKSKISFVCVDHIAVHVIYTCTSSHGNSCLDMLNLWNATCSNQYKWLSSQKWAVTSSYSLMQIHHVCYHFVDLVHDNLQRKSSLHYGWALFQLLSLPCLVELAAKLFFVSFCA